jgi:hypothetical protein
MSTAVADVMTFESMIKLLKKGKDKEGKPLDLTRFGRPGTGTKSLEDLHNESLGLDMTLYHIKERLLGTAGRILRVARSVKIYITATEVTPTGVVEYKLVEVERRRDGILIGGPKPWSISETRKRNEQVPGAAIRGLYEELGLIVTADQLEFPLTPSDVPDLHESSVYPGILSLSLIQGLALHLTKRVGGKRMIIIKDNDTEVLLKWERQWTVVGAL